MSKISMAGKFILATSILASLALSGCDGSPVAGNPPPRAELEEVGVVTLESQPVTITAELAGRTSAFLVAEVRPRVGGIIQKRLFTEGADVREGDVLYQLDAASYQAAYASARAALNKAEAVLTTSRSKVTRYKELLPAKAVSRQDYEEAAGLAQQAEADVDASKAALETARINLDYTRITSPISGRVGKSSVTTGALVTADQSVALCTVQQFDPMYVDVTQSSASLLHLKQRMADGSLTNGDASPAKVGLKLEDGSTYPLTGNLEFADVTVDQSTGTVTLRSVFPNPDRALLPGMYVRAVVVEGVEEQAILAPQRGITRDTAGNATALVVGEGDKVEAKSLQVATTMGDRWLVTAGLVAGDRLIVEGVQKGRAGMQVKTVQFGSPAAVAPNQTAPLAVAVQ